jgi:hypothetical protein
MPTHGMMKRRTTPITTRASASPIMRGSYPGAQT